jgi:murein DD-endopeptidase MepM/ murein hydrolase activator NlpD
LLDLRFPLRTLQQLSARHRIAVAGTGLALLAGFAVTAVAVAPMVPDAADLPRRLVVQTVEPVELRHQLLELAAQDLALTRSDLTRGTDTAESLLARLGVRDPSASAFLRTDPAARRVLSGRAGKMAQAYTDALGNLERLVLRFPSERPEQAQTHFTRLTLLKSGGRWEAGQETVPLTSTERLASGTIHTSLYAATDESGLPDRVASQLAEIFATDIDFHRQLRKGDSFSVVYESLLADGEPVAWSDGAGRVLAAEFLTGGVAHRAFWFVSGDGRGGYYDRDGSSKRRAFLASPLEFSRVSSGFAMRMHPLLQSWRAHLGVDYSAPTGTAVRSVGDGTVEFSGRQNGYGNVVQIRHGGERTTLYAHLSRLDVRSGQRVEQGQRLGSVGMTGWATGPHLHFEFRIHGSHQDPLKVARSSETVPLEAAARPVFADQVRSEQVRLEIAESTLAKRASVE